MTNELIYAGQGSTIGVHRKCTYAYFYWHKHDFRHAQIEMYAHFFLWFLKFFNIFLILTATERKDLILIRQHRERDQSGERNYKIRLNNCGNTLVNN